jgi:hypothetical protein
VPDGVPPTVPPETKPLYAVLLKLKVLLEAPAYLSPLPAYVEPATYVVLVLPPPKKAYVPTAPNEAPAVALNTVEVLTTAAVV